MYLKTFIFKAPFCFVMQTPQRVVCERAPTAITADDMGRCSLPVRGDAAVFRAALCVSRHVRPHKIRGDTNRRTHVATDGGPCVDAPSRGLVGN